MNVLSIPIAYGGYKLLRWAMSKIPTVIAGVVLWKKRSRIWSFIDNLMRRIENEP